MEKYTGDFGGNTKFKEKYLEKIKANYSKSTYGNTRNLLVVAKFYEDLFKKDLYDFKLSEMTDMLKGMRTRTKNSLKQKISVYKTYIDIAISEGVTLNNANTMDAILPKDYDSLIDAHANKERYITRDELYTDLSGLNNVSDQLLFMLLFDGVMGENYINLTNIKMSDINPHTREVKLFDGTTTKLSELTYNMCIDAYEEDTYESYGDTGLIRPVKLNEYLLRSPIRKKGTEDEPLTASALRTRIDLFKKLLGIAGLTGRSIYLSGVAQRLCEDVENCMDLTLNEINQWLTYQNVNTNTQEFKSILATICSRVHSGQNMGNVI